MNKYFKIQGSVALNNEINRQQHYTNVSARASLDLGSLGRSDARGEQSSAIGASALASQLLQHQQQVIIYILQTYNIHTNPPIANYVVIPITNVLLLQNFISKTGKILCYYLLSLNILLSEYVVRGNRNEIHYCP